MAGFVTEGVVGKAIDSTCIPLEFQIAVKHCVLFGELLVRCIWQAVGSLKTKIDIIHLQQDLLPQPKSKFDFAASLRLVEVLTAEQLVPQVAGMGPVQRHEGSFFGALAWYFMPESSGAARPFRSAMVRLHVAALFVLVRFGAHFDQLRTLSIRRRSLVTGDSFFPLTCPVLSGDILLRVTV